MTEVCKCCGQEIPKVKPQKTGCICLKDGDMLVAILYDNNNFVWKEVPTKHQIYLVRKAVKEILGYLPKDPYGLL
jgi:hypothetical protein